MMVWLFFYISSATNTGRSSRGQNQPSHATGQKIRRSSSTSSISHNSQASPSSHATEGTAEDSVPEDGSGGEDSGPDGPCPILGFSLGHADEKIRVSDQMRFPRFLERDLQKLIGTRPRGRVYFLDRSGQAMPGDTSSSGSGAEIPDQPQQSATAGTSATRRTKKRTSQISSLLKLIILEHEPLSAFRCGTIIGSAGLPSVYAGSFHLRGIQPWMATWVS